MQFTTFGRTGLTVSRHCLGTGAFGKQADERESFRIFDQAADAGVNFIDTADIYPGGADSTEVGSAEAITGRWLNGKRDRFILATKAECQMGPSRWDQGSSRKHLLEAIDASLRRLVKGFRRRPVHGRGRKPEGAIIRPIHPTRFLFARAH